MSTKRISAATADDRVRPRLEALTGVETRRIHVDKGYRGHTHAQKFRVWISGQVRRVSAPIRREMRRRAAVEPAIGHVKAEHRMGRNYLKGRDGDRINAVLALPVTTSVCSCAGSSGFARLDADAARNPSTSLIRLTNAPHRFFTDD